jgi:hypothetical protein
MARSIQKIKQNLDGLEEQVANLAVELGHIYEQYLDILSQSLKKQLVIATYQLCTQNYPETFLQLSFSQRQKFQENLRNFIKQGQSHLLSCLEKSIERKAPENQNIMETMLSQSSSTQEQEQPSPPSESPENPLLKIRNPEDLIYWSKNIERTIVELLNRISHAVNHLLQQFKIIPSHFPPQLLEMAIQSEEAGSPVSGSPNLLYLMIEKNSNDNSTDEERESKVTKVTVIHLRLFEIEFAEQALSSQRNQIRNLLEKLNQLRQQYQKKRREYAIAEAEAAWRSSWFEE